MTLQTHYVVAYRAVESDNPGDPTGGPPSWIDAVTGDHPDPATDTRLVGVTTNADGNPVGSPPDGEYREADAIDADTGDRVVRGRFPIGVQADAQDVFDSLKNDLSGSNANSYRLKLVASPLGAVDTNSVRAWYEAHPKQQPTDADGEPYIPAVWDPANHVIDSTTG